MRSSLLAAALLWATPAAAFQIGTTASTPCHERIMLGALDARDAPWQSDDDPALGPLVARLAARLEAAGAPDDKVTRGFVRDVAHRFRFDDRPPAEQAVLAAMVLGVRAPDTGGFTVVRLNELRGRHIDDSRQAMHSLRRSGDDGREGNAAALANARAAVIERVETAAATWHGAHPVGAHRWTFPLYGEADVRVLSAAVHLAEAAHVVQDAFTHTLRDDDLRVVTVLNYVDGVRGMGNEARDGLGHSDRLDTCDLGDAFDRVRVNAARAATARLLAAALRRFDDPTDDTLEAVLDDIYALREGCDVTNDYCGTTWLAPARSQLSEPIDIGLCAAHPGREAPAWPGALLALVALSRARRRSEKGALDAE